MALNIELLAAGTRPPAWIIEGFKEYQKRLSRDWVLQLHEIPIARRSRNTTTDRLKEEEGKRMLALARPGAMLVALDRDGTQMDTVQLASRLEAWSREYTGMQFMIGGPDGLSKGCIGAAVSVWSLSALTFPHFVVRILLAEQLYRSWTILNNHPYHK